MTMMSDEVPPPLGLSLAYSPKTVLQLYLRLSALELAGFVRYFKGSQTFRCTLYVCVFVWEGGSDVFTLPHTYGSSLPRIYLNLSTLQTSIVLFP